MAAEVQNFPGFPTFDADLMANEALSWEDFMRRFEMAVVLKEAELGQKKEGEDVVYRFGEDMAFTAFMQGIGRKLRRFLETKKIEWKTGPEGRRPQ